MNLVLLGATDRSLVVALEDALSDTRRAPRDIVWGWVSPDMTPTPTFDEGDLLMVLAQTPQASAWRQHLMQSEWPFQMAQGEGRHLVENIRYAWARHARSIEAQRPEIRPRYLSACENCADPECEHRLFRLTKPGL
jgi:hypothetical protein